MNNHRLLPKMAVNGIRKNGGMYLPYILTMTFAIAVFVIFSSIIQNKMLEKVPYSEYVIMLLLVGKFLLGIIFIPFLFYTNSFLIKGRKKEFGLYNILGLTKKQIGVVLLIETGIIYVATIILGSVAAIVFGKIVFLLLLNISGLPVHTSMDMKVSNFTSACILFGIIALMNLVTNLWTLGKANPTDLLNGTKKGEKEPKHLIVNTIVGIGFLGGGYVIAFFAKVDSMVFINFFFAVLLVIVGTYFLFTSGSIALLKSLRKNKKFYYKKENYVTISGMLYRMKKSAASLSNICIFSTMIIITLLCTLALTLGEDGAIRYNYPIDAVYAFLGTNDTDEAVIKAAYTKIAQEHRVKISNEIHFNYLAIDAYQMDDQFFTQNPNEDQKEKLVDLDKVKVISDRALSVKVLSLKDYETIVRATANEAADTAPDTTADTATNFTQSKLENNEVIIFTTKEDYPFQDITIDGQTYGIKEQIKEIGVDVKEIHSYMDNNIYIIVKDQEAINRLKPQLTYRDIGCFFESYQFDVSGENQNVQAFYTEFDEFCKTIENFYSSKNSLDFKQQSRSLSGGLLFIGIFFGIIFSICLILIMYYKQISEGMEDKANFEIMQEVGMDTQDVKSTIHRQIMLVFFMPLIAAIIHTFAGLNLTINLLYALNLYETHVIVICAGIVIVAFAVFYILSYSFTAKAYFKIVKRNE